MNFRIFIVVSAFVGASLGHSSALARPESAPKMMKGVKKAKRNQSRRPRNSRVKASEKTQRRRGTCRLKPMSQVKSLKIDREVTSLFKNLMTIDGALYPDRRVGLKSCCKKKDGTCYTASEAEERMGVTTKKGFRIIDT